MITPLPGAIPTKPGSATVPFFGVDAAVVDDEGREVGVNQGGKLVIRKPWPSMLRSIYGDKARYKKQYWSEIPGCYFAGDGARRDKDGYFWIVGRIDDVLNVAGHRLGTSEVESALVSHPAVAEAAVVGRPDEIKGQGVVAFVTLKAGVKAVPELREELRKHVGNVIGPIAKPDDIRFADALPKTRSGKIMRRLLKEIASGQRCHRRHHHARGPLRARQAEQRRRSRTRRGSVPAGGLPRPLAARLRIAWLWAVRLRVRRALSERRPELGWLGWEQVDFFDEEINAEVRKVEEFENTQASLMNASAELSGRKAALDEELAREKSAPRPGPGFARRGTRTPRRPARAGRSCAAVRSWKPSSASSAPSRSSPASKRARGAVLAFMKIEHPDIEIRTEAREVSDELGRLARERKLVLADKTQRGRGSRAPRTRNRPPSRRVAAHRRCRRPPPATALPPPAAAHRRDAPARS